MSLQTNGVAYKTKIPARSPINTRRFIENNNLYDPRHDDEGSLCDMHSQLYLLEVVDVEFEHFGNLSDCLEFVF